jgi:mono/diheme cytochrome c family protein
MPRERAKLIKRGVLGAGALFVLAQLVPYGHTQKNAPVVQEPKWDSTTTRELAHRACMNCHGNQTTWPWYSNIAPVSWLVASDVYGAREHLNFTEFQKPQKKAHDAVDEVQGGDMPPWFYVIMHPEAKLSDTDRSALIEGFKRTFESDKANAEHDHDDDKDK